MTHNDYIDTVAALTKLGIEMKSQPRDTTELAKAKIDYLSELLKWIQPIPKQPKNNTASNFEWVRQLKITAKKYSVDKVILFPYLDENQNLVPFLRAYGGETAKFFGEIGLSSSRIGGKITAEGNAILTQWEREYGIILYENDCTVQ